MSQLLRSEGYASKASIGLGLGGVLNIILDPIFMFVIFEPGNEVRGAAIATMISNVITFIYFLVIYLIIRKKTVISLNLRRFAVPKEHAKEVFAIGIPAALGSFFACLSSIIVNKLSSEYGTAAVTAIGAAKKIDMLPMNVGFGLSQGMMPLVAYNYAAGNYKRMRAFARTSRNAGMIFAGFCIVLFQIFAPQLVYFINPEAEAVALGTDFLRIFCLAVPLMIFNIQISFSFQAMGMGKQSLVLSSLRQGLVNIPLLFIMNHFFPLYGIVWTQLITDVVTAIVSYAVYRRSLGKLMTEEKCNSEG
jgi:Na+-driven multidrug efflux pump